MTRAVLVSCLPWLAVLLALFVCLRLSIRLGGARLDLGRLRLLHRDQQGSVQTLSFVLTLPVFVMVLLMIVQVSQLMIGMIVVHYAAFATARSAIVWIPARLEWGEGEQENRLSWRVIDGTTADQRFPVLDHPTEGGLTYLVAPEGPKYEKIASAAVLACAPICPSRDLGLSLSAQGATTAEILKMAYLTMIPGATNNRRIPRRLENKLAYALENTAVEIRCYHPNSEPPLIQYRFLDPALSANVSGEVKAGPEFQDNELGWQDQITVTVTHRMALLPGPGRLLARNVARPDGSADQVAARIGRVGNVYVYPLTASATLGLEGEKPVLPYVYQAD